MWVMLKDAGFTVSYIDLTYLLFNLPFTSISLFFPSISGWVHFWGCKPHGKEPGSSCWQRIWQKTLLKYLPTAIEACLKNNCFFQLLSWGAYWKRANRGTKSWNFYKAPKILRSICKIVQVKYISVWFGVAWLFLYFWSRRREEKAGGAVCCAVSEKPWNWKVENEKQQMWNSGFWLPSYEHKCINLITSFKTLFLGHGNKEGGNN